MNIEELEALAARHEKLHALIEAAEAEKAPEEFVKKLKVEKLNVRDQLAARGISRDPTANWERRIED